MAFACLSPAGALAAQATANLTVQATVVDSCTVADATLAFGTVNPTNGTAAPVTGTVNVTCTLGTAFSVGLDDGLNFSGGQRRMRQGASTSYLQYGLYRDVAATNRFGNAVTSERATGLVGLGLTATPVTVYGTVASGQAAPAGAYADTVPIVVYY